MGGSKCPHPSTFIAASLRRLGLPVRVNQRKRWRVSTLIAAGAGPQPSGLCASDRDLQTLARAKFGDRCGRRVLMRPAGLTVWRSRAAGQVSVGRSWSMAAISRNELPSSPYRRGAQGLSYAGIRRTADGQAATTVDVQRRTAELGGRLYPSAGSAGASAVGRDTSPCCE